MTRRGLARVALPLFVALASLLLAACARNEVASVRIDGSSTVFPITEAMAAEYSTENPDARVTVGFSGTGGGFEKFCRGEEHISNASRAIKDSEVEACAENGITDIVELQVAVDALTVAVHPSNEFVDCLTVQQLHDIFRRGGAERWSDVDPEWPDEPIVVYYPGVDSGTFDYFNEAVIENVDENASHRGDGTSSEDDNILLQGVAADENAIAYFGFAYFLEAGDDLKPVAIDDGHGCVEPSFETARSGEYTPLSRPLYIYTREEYLRENAAVRDFVDFYISHLEEIVPEVGYVLMDDATADEQRAKLAAAVAR